MEASTGSETVSTENSGPQTHSGVRVAAVTVVISTRDRAEELERSLASLLASDVLPSEIIIVDQSRDRRSQSIVGACTTVGVEIRYIRHTGRGLGTSQNIGFSTATQPIVAVTDDDCVVPPNWIATIEASFAAPDGIDLLTGRVLPLGADEPGRYAVSSRIGNRRVDFGRDAMPWDIGSGNNFAARREWLVRVGGNDERLGPGSRGQGGVDMDLFYRLVRAGARARYNPASFVYHARTTWAGRLRRRGPYGYGMAACCVIRLVEGDRHALQVLIKWLVLRIRRMMSAVPGRDWRLAYEEILVLGGSLHGALHGVRVARPPSSTPRATH
jgi:cellulose synthase/poly-beta-1,6-N-acetylglucosamine synthase-like glycosyltransferase